MKAGNSIKKTPTSFVKNLVGYSENLNKYYLFNKNEEIEYNLIYNAPILRGNILNFEEFDLIIEKTLENLNFDYNKNSLFIITHPNFHKNQKIELVKLFFENYNFQNICFGNNGFLSLVGLGEKNGIVLDSGHGLTSICPILDCLTDFNNINQINFGGNEVNEYIKSLLKKEGIYNINSTNLIEEIKHNFCYIPYKNKGINNNDKFKLPDGNEIELSIKIKKAGTILRKPELLFFDFPNIFDSLINTLNIYDNLNKNLLSSKIYLVGGNTNFKNFIEYLNHILNKKNFNDFNIKQNQDNQVFKGAYILNNLSSIKNFYINSSQYKEKGENILINSL